jgi:hypothetical protein
MLKLEDVPHRECSSKCRVDFLVDMGKGNEEHSLPTEQLLGLTWLGQWKMLSIYCISISLSISNDGEHSPSIVYLSLPSIYNDGKHSPLFLSSSLRSIYNDIEYSISKNPPFLSTNNLKDRENS